MIRALFDNIHIVTMVYAQSDWRTHQHIFYDAIYITRDVAETIVLASGSDIGKCYFNDLCSFISGVGGTATLPRMSV